MIHALSRLQVVPGKTRTACGVHLVAPAAGQVTRDYRAVECRRCRPLIPYSECRASWLADQPPGTAQLICTIRVAALDGREATLAIGTMLMAEPHPHILAEELDAAATVPLRVRLTRDPTFIFLVHPDRVRLLKQVRKETDA